MSCSGVLMPCQYLHSPRPRLRPASGDGKGEKLISPCLMHSTSASEPWVLTGPPALLPPAGQEAPGGADAQPGEPAALQARKGRKGAPLRRPLIAVCNDLYAPALRPLKAVAKVLQFRPPAADRLVTRLRMICGQEGVDIDKPVGGALQMHCVHGCCEASAWGSAHTFLQGVVDTSLVHVLAAQHVPVAAVVHA